jgi:hypothetical protein
VLTADEGVLLAQHLTRCPECGEPVIACDNGIRLDTESDDAGLWSLLNMGGAVWAAAAADDGSRHHLHEHQAAGIA